MPTSDLANIVVGFDKFYDCSDLDAVDKHISQVNKTLRKLAQSGKYPHLLIMYRNDIDLLLEHRLILQKMLLVEEAPC